MSTVTAPLLTTVPSPGSNPAAEETKTSPLPSAKNPKSVHLERSDDGAWRMTFTDNVGMRDINRLVKKLRPEFLRIKRRRRLQAKKDERHAEAQLVAIATAKAAAEASKKGPKK